MTRRQVFVLLLPVFFLFFLVTPKTSSAAFGVSPPYVNAVHLVPGSTYSQTIYLVQNEPDQDLNIKTTFDIPDTVRSWIKVDPGENFIIPNGVRQFPVKISIAVPNDAKTDAYRGTVSFATAPDQTGQVTIALGVEVTLNIVVGDDIFEKFNVPVVKPLDIEEGWNPRVYIKFNNEGNVSERFDFATFELFDRYGGVRLAYAQKERDFPITPPFTIKEYTIDFPIDFHLGLGQYWAVANFYQSNKLIATSQRVIFNVLEPGSLSGLPPYLAKAWLYLTEQWYYFVGILVAIILAAIWRWRSRRTRQRNA